MARYRNHLPQLDGGIFLTDSIQRFSHINVLGCGIACRPTAAQRRV